MITAMHFTAITTTKSSRVRPSSVGENAEIVALGFVMSLNLSPPFRPSTLCGHIQKVSPRSSYLAPPTGPPTASGCDNRSVQPHTCIGSELDTHAKKKQQNKTESRTLSWTTAKLRTWTVVKQSDEWLKCKTKHTLLTVEEFPSTHSSYSQTFGFRGKHNGGEQK